MTTTVVNIRGRHRENDGATPPGVVSIGAPVHRGGWHLEGSKWANPWHARRDGTHEERRAKYRVYLLEHAALRAALPELRGTVLGCWCKPEACHGDVLAALADGVGAGQDRPWEWLGVGVGEVRGAWRTAR